VTESSAPDTVDPIAGLARLLETSASSGPGGRPTSPAPTKQLAVITCMDARIDALADLGLEPGDAHVIRVAGGRVVDDVVRSLHLSTALLGTRGCLVVTHTDCGLHDRDGTLAERLGKLDPLRRDWATFSDPAAAVREDVDRLLRWSDRPDPWAVAGGVLDVSDGSLEVVVPPTSA
jgi:carbonic anhydrase